MAGAHRPVIAEVLKTSLSITLKEVREKRKEKKSWKTKEKSNHYLQDFNREGGKKCYWPLNNRRSTGCISGNDASVSIYTCTLHCLQKSTNRCSWSPYCCFWLNSCWMWLFLNHCEVGWTLEQVSHGGRGVSVCRELVWPWATCCHGPYFEQGPGWDDHQQYLPSNPCHSLCPSGVLFCSFCAKLRSSVKCTYSLFPVPSYSSIIY